MAFFRSKKKDPVELNSADADIDINVKGTEKDDFDYQIDDDLDYDYSDEELTEPHGEGPEDTEALKDKAGIKSTEDPGEPDSSAIPEEENSPETGSEDRKEKKREKKEKKRKAKEEKKKNKEKKKKEKGKKDDEITDKEEKEGEDTEKEEEQEERNGILPIMLCVAVAALGMGIAGYQIYSINDEYSKAEAEYEGLSQYTKTLDASMMEDMSGEEQETAPEDKLKRNYNRADFPEIEVDFDGLSEVNPDMVAWLYMGAVEMSYPVVRGEDNEYYLHHTFENAENGSGCVFMDSEVNPDLTSWNTFFYGHNMKNGTMFGSLKKLLREEGLYETDPYIYVFMRDGIYRYKIFSFYLDQPNSKMYYTCRTFKEYRQYVRKALEMSQHECNVPATENDNMITLVTCSGTGAGKKREFVHATFIDRYLYEDTADDETGDAYDEAVEDSDETAEDSGDTPDEAVGDSGDTPDEAVGDSGETADREEEAGTAPDAEDTDETTAAGAADDTAAAKDAETTTD